MVTRHTADRKINSEIPLRPASDQHKLKTAQSSDETAENPPTISEYFFPKSIEFALLPCYNIRVEK
jgi:hypothetical protein